MPSTTSLQPRRVLKGSDGAAACSPRLHWVPAKRACRRGALWPPAATGSELAVGHILPEQYFPASDLHAACFHEPQSDNDRLWKVFDRIWALQINASLARRGAGRCVLLVAFDPDQAPAETLQAALTAAEEEAAATAAAAAAADSSPSLGTRAGTSNGASSAYSSSSRSSDAAAFAGDLQLPPEFGFPRYGYWLSRLVDRPVWRGLGVAHSRQGILGVAQVDTFGDIIPPRTLSAQRDGALGWAPRQGYAYISNVAVSPSARRRGVATRLMGEAEALASSWGAVTAGLHVNPTNTPAVTLYRSLSYKKGVLEAPWMPYLQGRPPDRCLLMLKRLPRGTKHCQQQEAAAQGELQHKRGQLQLQ